ncbi:protein transport protein Sec31A isoform X2 [Chanos chanos]|uniref:Protein transport protein Sec31A n=1 Tax=Chanos chanos TaxID=29144 RepID=A0A6J2V295_CHACN|nr:protein transport protein Sec31A isoform X2 [Chanos chanos]
MKLKEINRTAIQAWSPAQHHPIYLAAGTSAQQLDATFSTNASLEIFELDLAEPTLAMKSCGALASPHRYHKMVWGPHDTDADGLPSGILIAGGENGNIILYDPFKIISGDSEAVIAQSSKHTGSVQALDVNSFQTNLVASGGNESEIYIWDLNNFASPMTPGPKTQPLEDISCVAWNRQVQHILASASPSGRASVWDLRKNDLIIKVSDHSNRMHCSGLAWHPEVATQLVLASEDDRMPVIQMWDLRFATSPLKVLENHTRGVLAIAWSLADPELLLSCGKDNRILCWNPNTAEVLYELPTSTQWCFDIQWCPRNPAVLSAAAFDGHISIYSIMGGSNETVNNPQVDQISASFGNMDPFGTGQTLPPLQLPQSSAPKTTVTPLKKPPKWIRRPVGASFAFGGKLVSLENVKPSPQQPQQPTAHIVHVSQVVTETAFLDRSNQLQATLTEGTFVEFCQSKIDTAQNEFEKTVWSFLKVNFENDVRGKYLELLGYKKEEVALKIASALEGKDDESAEVNEPSSSPDPAAAPPAPVADHQAEATPDPDPVPQPIPEPSVAAQPELPLTLAPQTTNQPMLELSLQSEPDWPSLNEPLSDPMLAPCAEPVLDSQAEPDLAPPVDLMSAFELTPPTELAPNVHLPPPVDSQPVPDFIPSVPQLAAEPMPLSTPPDSLQQSVAEFDLTSPEFQAMPESTPVVDLNQSMPLYTAPVDLQQSFQGINNVQQSVPELVPPVDTLQSVPVLVPPINAQQPLPVLASSNDAQQPVPDVALQFGAQQPVLEPVPPLSALHSVPVLAPPIDAQQSVPDLAPQFCTQQPVLEPVPPISALHSLPVLASPIDAQQSVPDLAPQLCTQQPVLEPVPPINALHSVPILAPPVDVQQSVPELAPQIDAHQPVLELAPQIIAQQSAPVQFHPVDAQQSIPVLAPPISLQPDHSNHFAPPQPATEFLPQVDSQGMPVIAPPVDPQQNAPEFDLTQPADVLPVQEVNLVPQPESQSDLATKSVDQASEGVDATVDPTDEEIPLEEVEENGLVEEEPALAPEETPAPEETVVAEETPTPEVTQATDPVNLKVNHNVDGLITQALLTGDFEAAVELCLHDNRMADGIILAIAGGPELLEKTQKKYLIKTQSKISKLISAVVTKDWLDILETCDLQNWKEALAGVMTYAKPEEFSSLCGLLGSRLEASEDPALQVQACLCYICAGSVEQLVACWTKAQDFHCPLSLQDLVEKVVVLRQAVVQTQGGAAPAVGALLAEKMSQYASLLASQGSLQTAISYLPNSADQATVQQLRDRLSKALGQQAAAPVAPVENVQPAAQAPVPAYTPAQPQPHQPIPGAVAPSAPHYFQQVRSASTVTSWSNQTPTALPSVPRPLGPAPNLQPEPSAPAFGLQSPVSAVPPTTSGYLVSQQYQTYPQVQQFMPAAGGPAIYQPLQYSSAAAPSLPAPPSSSAPSVQYPSQYMHHPVAPSHPAPPPVFPGPPPTGQPTASAPPPASSSFSPPPLSSGVSFQHGGPGSPTSYLPPPPMGPSGGINQDTTCYMEGPQNGWNDPPTLSRVPKKKKVPDNYTPPAPITAPIMAPLGEPQVQPVPMQPPQQFSGQPGAPAPFNPIQQQPPSATPANPAMPIMNMEGAPGAPTGDVIQPVQSMPAEKITKKPIPDEHLVLKTTFEGLIQKCLAVAADPQTRRKLDDANKRLESLYDKLRDQSLSPAIVSGLHNIVRSIESRAYTDGLNIHTHIVSNSNFSETSAFMPVLKVVLTQANKLGV